MYSKLEYSVTKAQEYTCKSVMDEEKRCNNQLSGRVLFWECFKEKSSSDWGLEVLRQRYR
jgi:hypothetical protein